MKKSLFFLITFIIQIFIFSSANSEPLFEKDSRTGIYPETKIIRYRVLSHEKGEEGYAFSFTGKIVRGRISIQIEDTKKNIIEKKEIPAFSLLHWHFMIPKDTGLDNIYISLHFKNAVGNVYSVVAPAIEPLQIYITYIVVVGISLFLIAVCVYIIGKKSLPISWLLWGILLGICAKILFYICDYFDFLPTTLLINSSVAEEQLSDYIFATYISLRETAIVFILIGIFSVRWFTITQKKATTVSISLGLTLIFLLFIVISEVLEMFQFVPDFTLLSHSQALMSVQASRSPLIFLFVPLRNTILCGLWFSAFYLTISGTLSANKRAVLHGILIFIITEAVLVYFENSYFTFQYSSWWNIVVLAVICFFPIFLFKFRPNIYRSLEQI